MRTAESLAEVESRLREIGDLVSRLSLLKAQYRSDLARLEMVTEAGSILGFFRVGTCVFCGAEPEHQNPGHGDHEATQLHITVQNETAKTNALLTDLLPTIQDLRTQFDDLSARRGSLIEETAQIDEEITGAEELITPIRERLQEILQARSSVERALELPERIDELEERRSRLVGEGAVPATRPAEYVPTRILSVFDETPGRTLDAWEVPAVEFAEYDQYTMDIRAGCRHRANHGKGVRSVLHSAFTTALANYCLNKSTPHLGFVVLDSPIVAYRDPIIESADDDITLTSTVVDHFTETC